MPETRLQSIGGPWFQLADEALVAFDEYRQFRAGKLTREQYVQFIDRARGRLVENGLPPDDVEFAKRYPFSEREFVAGALRDLAAAGVLSSSSASSNPDSDGRFTAGGAYFHGAYHTYIYPEERRLLYEITRLLQPRVTVFLGSYYGYWASAAIAALPSRWGKVVLIDPDEHAQEVASKNFRNCENVEIAVMTAQKYLSETVENFDLIVLDAEGPRNHPDIRQRGKRIYEPLLECAISHASPGSVLVCHNIILHDETGVPFLQRIVERNLDELHGFMKLVREFFPNFTEISSTEGVGAGSAR